MTRNRLRMSGLLLTFLVSVGLLSAGTVSPVAAQKGVFKTKARQAILIDGQSGSILFSHNADEQRPPASMSKLMTLVLIFKALKSE